MRWRQAQGTIQSAKLDRKPLRRAFRIFSLLLAIGIWYVQEHRDWVWLPEFFYLAAYRKPVNIICFVQEGTDDCVIDDFSI